MLTTQEVLYAYKNGVFPMADPEENNQIFWYEPELRGVIFLNQFHISKNLNKLYKNSPYKYKIDNNFELIIKNCSNREETWISDEIIEVYCHLNLEGKAHSFEVYENNDLIGGLYGVRINKIFFGESMFHLKTNASKLALCFLKDWMIENSIELLDCQFITDHLKQFGAIEISQDEYLKLLHKLI